MRRYYAANEEYREATKARAKAHAEKQRAEDPEAFKKRHRERAAKWREANREHYNEMRRKHNADARERAKLFVNALKRSTPCGDCGGFFPPVVMDFDHVNGDKVSAIARLVGGGASEERLLREISKCELVCANCHRVRTSDRLLKEGFDMEEAL